MEQTNVQRLPIPSENASGLRPCGRAVLVKAHQPEMDRARDKSAIFIPTTVEESTAVWENRMRVVAVGACAWADEPEPRAKPGDLVLVTKFAGFVKRGADGKLYRLINDRDLFCVIEKEAENDDAWDEPLLSPPNRENSADFGEKR